MPVRPTSLAGLGSGTARLTETILLTPGNLTALATARLAIFPPSAEAPPKDHARPQDHAGRPPHPPIDQGQGVVRSAGAVRVRGTGLCRAGTRRSKHRDRAAWRRLRRPAAHDRLQPD